MREHKLKAYFATDNPAKFSEAVYVTESYGIELRQLTKFKVEIQSQSLSEIASFAAGWAAKGSGLRVVSEDAGLFVNALNGYPGPYSSYVFKTLGLKGILKLLNGASDRGAYFRSAVAYCEPHSKPICFTSKVTGKISSEQRGHGGFGFDPIFIPAAGDGRTFAETTGLEKNLLSHRAKAFAKFSRWFISRSRNRPRRLN